MIKAFRAAVIVVLTVISIVVGGGAVANAGPLLPGLPSLQQILNGLRPGPSASQKLSSGFTALSKSMAKNKNTAGQIGVAVVPVGTDLAQSFGTLKSGRAWSTFKVPVALASQRRNGARVAADEAKAIQLSDNDAATDLWNSFGSSSAAVAAVTAVLREGHDTVTHVSSELEHSYPGYTNWALVDQARFAAHLPCMNASGQILHLMGSVAANQRWGIQAMRRPKGVTTAVKGGWGPLSDKHPGYLVRQLGLITTNRGSVAITMAAIPRTGSFEDGQKMLNRIGGWVSKNLSSLPTGQCLPV